MGTFTIAKPDPEIDFVVAADQLISIGQWFYSQKWVLGTSGNFSGVLSREPFRLLITASGIHKGTMDQESFLEIDHQGNVIAGDQRPSAETLIHLAIISETNAGAILHTHSVWATILSDAYAASGGVAIQGYEMLKGLSQVKTHDHKEWLPILENSQDYAALSQCVLRVIREKPEIHGILLRNHGLYTWGNNIEEARRHIEIFEFLLEVLGRKNTSA